MKKPASATCSNADKELLILLVGLEKIVLFCLTERSVNDDWFTHVKSDHISTTRIPDNSALIGLAQVVHDDETKEKARDIIMFHLPIILHILLDVWRILRTPQWDKETIKAMGDAKADAVLHSFSFAAEQAKHRLQVIFEKLFKFSNIDFVEGLTEIFFMENPSALEFEETTTEHRLTAMEILSNTSTPQHIVSNLLDSIRQRTPNTYQSRRRKILRQGKL